MKVGIALTFDLLHAGRLKMIEESKLQYNNLNVGFLLEPSIFRPEKNVP